MSMTSAIRMTNARNDDGRGSDDSALAAQTTARGRGSDDGRADVMTRAPLRTRGSVKSKVASHG
jgi:hypothetical protein